MIQFISMPVKQEDFLEEAKQGLKASPKKISPKFFYDRKGSELFEQIVSLDEYYIPEAEKEIYRENASAICKYVSQEPLAIVELGSGSSEKIREIISHLPNLTHYVPIDISEEFLKFSAEAFAKDHPKIEVVGICADFSSEWKIPENILPEGHQKLFYFPGSTLGNFDRPHAIQLLQSIAKQMNPNDFALMGVDRIKPEEVLKAAYNDKKNVTAAFNKNLLTRIKSELKADLDESDFVHEARFNQERSRIEMHLIAQKDLSISLDGESFQFKKGESIHTESSHKYSPESFSQLASEAGFQVENYWSDTKDYFGVYLLKR